MRYVIALLVVLVCSDISAGEKTHFTVGVVPQFSPQKITAVWMPILKAVAEKSGVDLRLVASPSIPEFEKSFAAGEFDFAYMNPYHLLVANRAHGYIPLLKDKSKKLRGIIVVAKESPIRTVKNLNGKTVAFPAPNALGAALIPRAEFATRFHIRVNELYVNSHSSVYLNVATGVADAGGGVQKTLASQPENIRDLLRVLYKTEAVSPHPIAVHPRVNKLVVDKVVQAFLQISNVLNGRLLLQGIPIKSLTKATLAEYKKIEALGLDAFYVKDSK